MTHYSFDDLYPSNYVSVADLDGRSCALVISSIAKEEMPDGKMKPALSFKGAQKRLLLNRTNANTLREMFGEPGNWIGRKVELYCTTTSFQGRMVPCVRLRPAASAPGREPPPHVVEPGGEPARTGSDLDDRIPF